MKKTFIRAALVALLGLAGVGGAQATLSVSSASVVNVTAVPLNTQQPKSGSRIRGLRVCNDTSVATCLQFQDNAVTKFVVCAASQACTDMGHDGSNGVQQNMGGMTNFAGEVYTTTNTFTVKGSTPSASIWASVWYDQPFK